MQTFQIGVGIGIIVLTFLDFFHSTLSGKGFGFISGWLNRFLNRVILLNKSRSIFTFSGLTHLLMTAAVWLALLFLGSYLIFTAGEEMVVTSSGKLPADYLGRFYYTAYVLSTLGIGNLIPGNATSEVISGILSFTGFVLISTGLTYLMSVVQAVLKKKELAFYISTLGEDIEQLYNFFKNEEKLETLMSDTSNLRKMIFENASSYLAFPMVGYFLTNDRNSALIIQLASLYEVLMVLQMDWEEDSVEYLKLRSIIEAIQKYLALALEKPRAVDLEEDKLKTLRSYWRKFGYIYKPKAETDKQFTSRLKYSGWRWEDVYSLEGFN